MNYEIAGVFQDIARDVREPGVIWQISAIVLAFALAWFVVRVARRQKIEAADRRVRVGFGGVKRVLFPLAVLMFLLLAREALRRFGHVSLVDLAAALAGALALIRLVVYALRQIFPHQMLARFERWIAAGIWIVFALHLLGVWPRIVGVLDSIGVGVGRQKVSVWTVAEGSFWIVVAVFAALWIGSLVQTRLLAAEGMHMNARLALARFAQAVLVLLAILVVLPAVGIDLTVLSVFGGAIGVGLGFGLQKIASSYVSGFIVLLDRSIRLGDLITADNFHGVVQRMTTRYTVVKSLDGREAIIPNETLITSTVINHSFSDKRVRLAVRLQVGYGSEVERAMRVLESAARGHSRVLVEPPPTAAIAEFADSGVGLELGFWVADPESGTLNVRSDISLEALKSLRREGIELPFPQREVRILGGSVGNAPSA